MAINMRFKDGKFKALTLSYDDGVIQDKRLMEILDKHGIKATFNVNGAGFIPEDADAETRKTQWGRRMKLSEAKELYIGSGHEVAVHTLTHPWIAALNDAEILKEVYEDRKVLEKEFGTIIRGMAYPYGCFNDRVVEMLKACGIVYSRTVIQTENFRIPEDWLRLNSTCHHNNPKLMELAENFVDSPAYANTCQLFYVWGHSYEFDNNNNWDVIERFAEFVGGRDNIWYATNIEIYDYVQAFKNLQMSADNGMIHNPSAIDVWVNANGEDICIKSGKTVKL